MVRVTKNFFIDGEENCFVVYERKVNKESGKETKKSVGFYSTIDSALNGIFKILSRRAIHKYDMNLEEAIEKLKMIEEKIMSTGK